MIPPLYKINQPAEIPNFHTHDSLKLFVQNICKQGADWPWRNRKVHYTVNSHGYRGLEFDQVDWDRSILCFGCSITVGIGVDDRDTWPSQLSRLLGVPTVNLGVAGGSVQINWANSVRLITAGIRPRAVVYYWPEQARHCEFQQDGSVLDHWNSWSSPVYEPGRAGHVNTAWAMMPHHHRAVSELMISSLSWSCPRVDLTWADHPPQQIKQWRSTQKDLGRDLVHPGPLSHAAFAQSVARELKSIKT
jgi:hypothetical protein